MRLKVCKNHTLMTVYNDRSLDAQKHPRRSQSHLRLLHGEFPPQGASDRDPEGEQSGILQVGKCVMFFLVWELIFGTQKPTMFLMNGNGDFQAFLFSKDLVHHPIDSWLHLFQMAIRYQVWKRIFLPATSWSWILDDIPW